MCEPEEIRRIHSQTNDEIHRILTALSEKVANDEDKELEILVFQLREILGKRFLINGIVDWQLEE